MRFRAVATAALLAGVASASCGGGAPPLEPTSAAPARPAAATAPVGGATAQGEGFFILVVQCEPKEKGIKRHHFEVTPVRGDAPPLQLRCKGQGDLHGAGPWLVRPMSDTDQSYVCTPSPITLKEDKKKNRVVCRKG